jgi:hypothetical protein
MESIPDWALDAELEGITLSLISGPSSVIVSVAYDLDVETPDTPTDKLNTYKSEHLNVGRFSAQSARVRGKDA